MISIRFKRQQKNDNVYITMYRIDYLGNTKYYYSLNKLIMTDKNDVEMIFSKTLWSTSPYEYKSSEVW